MINAVIIGASGYTGVELVRILLKHEQVNIKYLVANSNAGQKISAIYPHLIGSDLPDLVKLDEVDFADIQVVFCCLPHATSQEVISELPLHLKVIDLSADFRLRNPDTYKYWYGKDHAALEQQHEAVYGLSEIYREDIKHKRIVACPGCYPTSMLLPLIPLLKQGLISHKNIIIDAKSGMTGAGKSAKTANLFTEMNDNIKAYGIGGHRHVSEVEQELSVAAQAEIMVTFTPQIVAMSRGILSNIYVDLADGETAKDLRSALIEKYQNEPFIVICDEGYAPATKDVYGTNKCMISVFDDRVSGKAIIVSVIDNLVKGSSGQAVQNFNIAFGFDEAMALETVSLFP